MKSTNLSFTKKISSVSMAKAIAIILMVVAHTSFSDFGGKLINMFHMPLFFFFAGYCFKDEYLRDFKSFALKRVKGLYIPYVKWSLLFLICHNIFYHLNIYNSVYGFRGKVSFEYTFNDFAFRVFSIVVEMSGHEMLLGGFWFIKSLFLSSFIAFFVIKYIKNSLIAVVFFVLVSTILSLFNKQIIDIGAREFLGALFFYIGYLYKKNGPPEVKLWIIPSATILLIVGTFLWQMGLLHIVYWKIIPWVISACLGILCTFKVCQILERKKFKTKYLLIYIGDNTLTVLIWHFLCFKIVSLFIIILYKLPYERLAEFPVIQEYSNKGWWIIYCLVGILVPIMVKMGFEHKK